MKILYGTSNKAKLSVMRKYLAGLNFEILGLMDMSGDIPYVEETGDTPMENAIIKAKAYYNRFKMPVFSCDSGLYFKNIPEISPKSHVRTINGKTLTDEEMINYYSGLAKNYGDITAYYKNAICFILDENNVFTDNSDDLENGKFIITSIPHQKRNIGFPIDCLSKNIDSGKYYYDIDENKVQTITGFKRFFGEIFDTKPLKK